MPNRRGRSFTPQFNAQVILEVLAGLESQAEVVRQHKVKPELIRSSSIWRSSWTCPPAASGAGNRAAAWIRGSP